MYPSIPERGAVVKYVTPAAGMTLTSATTGGDGKPLPVDAAAGGDCGGKNVSPALAWTGTPAGTASIALAMTDPDGRKGAGVVHWLAYGIAPATTSIPAGFASQPSSAFTGGTNTRNTTLYFGPCPPPGDTPHHYILTVYALDLAPGALAPGLTRDAFMTAIQNHVLGVTTTIATYGR